MRQLGTQIIREQICLSYKIVIIQNIVATMKNVKGVGALHHAKT